MRITLIKPGMYEQRSYDAMEPLALGVLAALTPDHVELSFYDDRLEDIPYDDPTDLAALSVETFSAKRAYQISSEFTRRQVPVVLGGYHPTLAPEEALEYADAVVIGDVENVWHLVLRDTWMGRLRRVYRHKGNTPPCIGKVDRGIFTGKKYAPISLVQHGRGCRFSCDFCSIKAFYGSTIFQRSSGETMTEIEGAYPQKLFFFVDDNFFPGTLTLEALLRALIPLKIHWACQISLDISRNRKLLKLMKESGCTAVLVGFESLRNENLKQMGKRLNLKHDYEESIRIFRDMGIMVYGTFVFGYDHDTPEIFDETVDFALRSKLFLANFNPLMAMPGTPLYRRLKKENRLTYEKWWLAEGFRYGEAMFYPKGMTPDQLTEGCLKARKDFYSHSSILRRLLDSKANGRGLRRLKIYLSANYISKKEIMQKQGKRLGRRTRESPEDFL